MKKILIFISGLALFFCFTTKTEASTLGIGVVSTRGSNLNVRENPSTSSNIISTLANGTYVLIVGSKDGFYKVEYHNDSYGYVAKNYVEFKGGNKATTLANLNIRKGASTSSLILTTLKKGESLYIISSDTYWSKVLCNGTVVGYAYNTYLNSSTNKYKNIKLDVIDYKQYDTRWASLEIVSGKTIRQIGCLTTCFAMSESFRTKNIYTPKSMLSILSYTSSGDAYWPSNYITSTSNDYLNTIYNNLKAGKPTIIGAKSSSSMHFVIVTGFSGYDITASSFIINDPASTKRTTLFDFFNSYNTFYKIAYYK